MFKNRIGKRAKYILALNNHARRKWQDKVNAIEDKYPLFPSDDTKTVSSEFFDLLKNGKQPHPGMAKMVIHEYKEHREKLQSDPEYLRQFLKKLEERVEERKRGEIPDFGGILEKPRKSKALKIKICGVRLIYEHLPVRLCPSCGGFFYVERPFSSKKYCSDRCAKKEYNERRNEKKHVRIYKNCVSCGKQLSGKRAGTKTCSGACRKSLYRKNKVNARLTQVSESFPPSPSFLP